MDLSEFLSEWKKEIEGTNRPATEEIKSRSNLLGKRKSSAVIGEYGDRSSSECSQAGILRHSECHAVNQEDVAPLFVLPACKKLPLTKSKLGLEDKRTNTKESLVDALISDLDEINSIPFFDIQLPREIAILIFSYLDMKDLCNCSLVSKSWSSLANDNVLWSQISQRMGYSTSAKNSLTGTLSWKRTVRDLVVKRRQVDQNWKERVCRICDHQPDNCGVLCCLSYENRSVLSCYSSGAAYVWNMADGGGPVCVSCSTQRDQLEPPTPINCAIHQSGWGVIGNCNGSLDIIDTRTCSHVQTVSGLGFSIDSVSISCSGAHTAVAVATQSSGAFNSSIQTNNIAILLATEGCSWEKRTLLPQCENKISKVSLLPYEGDSQSHFAVLYSTSTSLSFCPLKSTPTSVLASVTDGESMSTCITCFDFSSSTIACGTSAFGYQIQLFDLHSLSFKNSLRGHGQQVTCLNIATSPPNMVVSGSADRRVRLFDARLSQPALVLTGHGSVIYGVQMDDWKVVSGSYDGTVIVWDQRMARELWWSHERHPVKLCCFDDHYLVVGHVPVDKHPEIYTGSPHICHRRQRGLLRVYDFSTDPLYYTKMLPSVCSSVYDEPSASFHNLDLKYPYDNIT